MLRHTRLVLAAFYLTNFAILGLFVPYFGLYLRALGFSDTRIGILLALIPLAKAALPGLWGSAADRWGIRRPLMVLATWAALAVFCGFLGVTSFVGCLILLAIYAALAVPTLPFVEATTLEYVHRSGSDYGRIRVAGSVGFAITALAYGRLAGEAAATAVVPALIGAMLLNAIATSMVPPTPGRPRSARLPLKQLLALPAVGLLLFAGFLMQASHGAYIGFFSLVLQENNYSSLAVGLAWAGAIAAEVVLMLVSARLVATLGARGLMALSLTAAALRWFLYAGSIAVPALILGQALHAFTYAGFHVAAVQTIQRLVPEGSRSTGQALYSGWTFGAGITLGTVLSGIVKDHLGATAMFLFAGGLAVGALCLVAAGKSLPGRQQNATGSTT